jgi:hypothetical protein
VHNLIEFTSGPASGFFTWGAKVTSPGNLRLSNIAQVSTFPLGKYNGGAILTPPVAGNTYNVLNLTQATLGYINVGYEGNPTFAENLPVIGMQPGGVYFELLHFTVAAGDQGRWAAIAPVSLAFNFNRCKVDNSIDMMDGQFLGLNSGFFGQGDPFRGGLHFISADSSWVFSGLIDCSPGTFLVSASVDVRAGKVFFDGDVLVQNCAAAAFSGGEIQFAAAGIFDNANTFGDVAGGANAVNGGTLVQAPFFTGILGEGEGLYGNGNIGTGVHISNFSSMDTGAALNTVITGAGGDFDLAQDTTTLWGFNLATGVYVGPTTATWAHLAAPLAAGTGFGGAAINPKDQAIIT